MLEFSFEIIDESKINIVYQYGSSSFNFNLFFNYGVWTLHPFDGILLQNKEMCRLIVTDLFKNKDFHVMLARENILLSTLRTSIDLNPETRGERYQEQDFDELSEFAETHSFEDVLQIEQDSIRERMDFSKTLSKGCIWKDSVRKTMILTRCKRFSAFIRLHMTNSEN